MDVLFIDGADDVPKISLDKNNGIFEFEGKSLPEDVIEFYAPVFKWCEEYAKDPNPVTEVKMNISYYNSASQRAINEIFSTIKKAELRNSKVTINWYYDVDDEEMLESGKEFADITNLNFNYISYQP